jgi:HEPN domain-containing protein
MSAPNDVLGWVARAEEDFLLARSCLRRVKPLTVSACFHAQQSAEKYLKALLLASGQPFPRTHDLGALNELCSAAGILVSVDENDLDLLTAYAVQVRYPGVDPTPPEARHAVATARDVRRFARRFLGLR